MPRTKGTQIYKMTGDMRRVQLLLGHAQLESAVRYLGVKFEDVIAIAQAREISGGRGISDQVLSFSA